MSSSAVYDSPGKPLDVAQQLISEKYDRDGIPTLRWWRANWYAWNGSRWASLDEDSLRSWIYNDLGPAQFYTADGQVKDWAPDRVKVSKVIDAMKAVCRLDRDVEPHSWIDDGEHPPAEEIVALENGLLHTPTRQLLPPTPMMFNMVASPFAYGQEATSPEWDAFMSSIWLDDTEAIEALQDWFGYVLSGRTDLQKMLLLIGPPRAGKGVIGRTLTALAGPANVAGPTLASLGQNFGLFPLIGKSLALVSDARLRSDSQVVVERLLTISGEDIMNIDRKNIDPWVGKLSARFMLMTNELPRLGDVSQALSKRFVTVSLTRSFDGNEDSGLGKRLLQELPGIFNWALDGLDRLTERGHFVSPLSSLSNDDLLAELSSPVSVFLGEETVPSPGSDLLTDDLYTRYRNWCEGNGHNPTAKVGFMRDVLAALPGFKSKVKNHNGKSKKFVPGLAFRPSPAEVVRAHSKQGLVGNGACAPSYDTP